MCSIPRIGTHSSLAELASYNCSIGESYGVHEVAIIRQVCLLKSDIDFSGIRTGGLQAVKEEIVAPDPQLLESMRSVGYTVEAAVADVIDNSIAADAENVDILISAAGPFEMSIVDDGAGMSESVARDAMRLAARSPLDERRPGDLGRFGLGLKTASLSQCRRLTVVTKQSGIVIAYCWNLDHVMQTNSWALLRLEPEEYQSLLGWEILEDGSDGTLVNWRDLDQLQITEGHLQEDLDAASIRVRDHLSLVFHRFLDGLDVPKRVMRMNGLPFESTDPFLAGHKSTLVGPVETIRAGGATVTAQAYTLPYPSRLSRVARESVLKVGQLRDSQGFYVYRAHRLVIWGTWFRVTPRSEMAKLTRVKVDVPNTLDHLWALDIKKSAAEPPPEVRKRLRELAVRMTSPSHKVQRFRGRRTNGDNSVTRMWNLIEDREEFRYEINREHPEIQHLGDQLPSDKKRLLSDVLSLVEVTFPVVDSHNRLSQDRVSAQDRVDEQELLDNALDAWPKFKSMGFDVDRYVEVICSSEPFNLVASLPTTLRKELAT